MSARNRRVAVAGVIAAAAIAVPTAALAYGSQTPSVNPPKPPASAAAAKTSQGPTDLSGLASSAGISTSQLNAGLVAAKRAGGNSSAGIAAFAVSTGVTSATAQRIVYAVFGTHVENGPTGKSMAAALATQLGISPSAAQHAMKQIITLSGNHGVDPASTAFAAVAHELGVSPARLAQALVAAKRSVAGG
ncbi:MAG TPA: hypothetical protein VKD26_10350 [Streptosporangiaceae bacterium]|nr:hypothetical protein [Streptosporangiaceae bacterium]